MKLKDWLKSIILPLVNKPDDADLFLSASDLKEVEVGDDMQRAYNEYYLTRERAVADKKVVETLMNDAWGQTFGAMDKKIAKILPLFTEEDQKAINAERNTNKKMDLLERAIMNANKSEDIKKITQAARDSEISLRDEIEKYKVAAKKVEDESVAKIQDVKMDYALRNKMAGIELASDFATEKHKTFLADSTIDFLKKNYILQFDEQDARTIHLRKNVGGIVKDVFEGDNKKVTLDDVIRKEYEPYAKKSNSPNPDRKPDQQKQQQVNLNDKPITLEDRRRAAAEVGV